MVHQAAISSGMHMWAAARHVHAVTTLGGCSGRGGWRAWPAAVAGGPYSGGLLCWQSYDNKGGPVLHDGSNPAIGRHHNRQQAYPKFF